MYIYIYVCMYVCMYVGTYVRMYACMYVCMYVCSLSDKAIQIEFTALWTDMFNAHHIILDKLQSRMTSRPSVTLRQTRSEGDGERERERDR